MAAWRGAAVDQAQVSDLGFLLVVLDWTGAALAHPCFDLAFTELLLATRPSHCPARSDRSTRRRAACWPAASGRATPANPQVWVDQLDWFRALHSARVLVEVADLRAAHGPGGAGHPFLSLAPAAASQLSRTAGDPVTAR